MDDHHAEQPAQQDTQPAIDQSSTPASAQVATVLLVIDARVADHQSLLADLPANVMVRVIDNDESGLEAIGAALAEQNDVEAVHILSHGTPGAFSLGSDQVNDSTLASHTAQLQGWADHLSADADILLYGCDIGAGDAGEALITQLAVLTGTDIAASTDATGAADKGGDWELEARTASIEAGMPFSAAALAGYGELLADAAPTVAFANLPSGNDHLLGTDFTFNLEFRNTGSAAGYGPYIDLYLPRGADGNTADPAQRDGITIASSGAITYLEQAVNYQVITLDGSNTQDHPYARLADGSAAKLTGQQYDQVVVIELPFGSYTTGQPAASLSVTAHISDLADVGTALALKARAGFRYGDTALASDDPSAIGAAINASVTPVVVEQTYVYNGPEGETATGPNFPRSFTTTITVAPGHRGTGADADRLRRGGRAARQRGVQERHRRRDPGRRAQHHGARRGRHAHPALFHPGRRHPHRHGRILDSGRPRGRQRRAQPRQWRGEHRAVPGQQQR